MGATSKFIWPIPDKGLKKRIHRVTAPTLVVWGKEDRLVPLVYADKFTRRISGSRLQTVDGAGHAPQVEQPDRVARLVRGVPRRMKERTLRGQVAVAGVGETTYYKHGQAPEPEFKLALQAILRACDDAGIDAARIDGFASYSNDRNDPSRLAAALGLPELRFSNMQWGGGGGGGSAAVGNAAAAIAAGLSPTASSCSARSPRASSSASARRRPRPRVSGEAALTLPVRPDLAGPALRDAGHALHARPRHRPPTRSGRSRWPPITTRRPTRARSCTAGRSPPEAYDASRWIVEPFRLFDCCMENDGAAALILVAAERARDLRQRPAYLLGVAQGSEYRNAARGHNAPLYATSSFTTVAPHLYEMAGVAPEGRRRACRATRTSPAAS